MPRPPRIWSSYSLRYYQDPYDRLRLAVDTPSEISSALTSTILSHLPASLHLLLNEVYEAEDWNPNFMTYKDFIIVSEYLSMPWEEVYRRFYQVTSSSLYDMLSPS
jgi:hypothetical protein